MPLTVTPFSIAQRFVGLSEVRGAASNPLILAMLTLDASWPKGDDVAWCSAFVNAICWLLRLPRSKSLAARSWLTIGEAVEIQEAQVGFDVVVLKRGGGAQPGPEVTSGAPGHVGFFAGISGQGVHVLGGNQADQVSVEVFPYERLLGIRRLG